MTLTNRERFVRLMRGQPVDRAPFFPCFGPWPETLERWRREGLPADAWLAGGVTCLFPWETQMGLDITGVRRKYPALQMIGGINKYALALGRAAIDDDLRKVPFMLESGRYLPAVDHFVPPDVSWDNYRYFCERLRGLLEKYPPDPG